MNSDEIKRQVNSVFGIGDSIMTQIKSKILHSSFGYENSSVVSNKTLEISKMDYIRSILSLGAYDYAEYDKKHYFLHMVRFGALVSTLPFLEFNNRLSIDTVFKQLDRSEKSSLSYWYGMTFTKIVAEQLFDIPWLAYIDKLISAKVVDKVEPLSGKVPDLAGLSKLEKWHIFEAKGRLTSFTEEDKTKAKEQAKAISAIKGSKPITSNVCATILFKNFRIKLYDPVIEDEGISLTSSSDGLKTFFEYYYYPFIHFFRKYEKNVKESKFKIGNELVLFNTITIQFMDNTINVSMPKEILENPESASKVCSKLESNVGVEGLIYFSLGKDGILVYSDHDFSIDTDRVEFLAKKFIIDDDNLVNQTDRNDFLEKYSNSSNDSVEKSLQYIRILR